MTSRFHPEDEFDGTERRRVDLIQNNRIAQLEHQIADIAVVMRKAVSEGMQDAMTNPEVLTAMWGAAMTQSQKAIHQRAGRWLFSKWFAIGALVVAVASYIGWPATIKLLVTALEGD